MTPVEVAARALGGAVEAPAASAELVRGRDLPLGGGLLSFGWCGRAKEPVVDLHVRRQRGMKEAALLIPCTRRCRCRAG